MKVGKQGIHDLPVNDITTLGSLAQQLEQEARARGEALPAAARLQIGEPSFRTPEHICAAACRAIESNSKCNHCCSLDKEQQWLHLLLPVSL